jgi:hypothetical protein
VNWTNVIDKIKSYLVSFLVTDNSGQSDGACWTESTANPFSYWVLPASLNPDEAMTRAANWSSLARIPTNVLFGVEELYTSYPTNGTFVSPIVDTHQTSPAYQDIGWHSIVPSGTTLNLKVRSGNNSDLSDASAWTNIATSATASAPSGSASISPGTGRYVQFQAIFDSDIYGNNTPKLKDVTVRWTGVQRIVNMGGTFSKGPDHGVWELSVDGYPLVKACNMDLTIYKDMPVVGGQTRRITSTVSMEIYPRNTDK